MNHSSPPTPIIIEEGSKKKTTKTKTTTSLEPYLNKETKYEICIDEAGRGPMFGRVYVAACILPKDMNQFSHKDMKDSKKIKSKKKMQELAEYIKSNSIAWHITYMESTEIDKTNILKANMNAMHKCICKIINDLGDYNDVVLLIDGNYFTPYHILNESTGSMDTLPYHTIEGGDNKYSGIAAASILAKHARDQYIEDLCHTYPVLQERYSLHTNQGYGTKAHLDGITQYGITQWHRQTFGCCKTAPLNPIPMIQIGDVRDDPMPPAGAEPPTKVEEVEV